MIPCQSPALMTPPCTIAHYRITAKLGEGGMGAVYRATDTKLGREVAIKVLPDEFAADRDRMARFSREAEVLASLNHPGIAAIYGVEDRALIMELVTGPTLADRIAEGPIPANHAAGPPPPPMKPRTSCCRLPQRSNTRTIEASSTATSSPPTSRSIPRIKSK